MIQAPGLYFQDFRKTQLNNQGDAVPGFVQMSTPDPQKVNRLDVFTKCYYGGAEVEVAVVTAVGEVVVATLGANDRVIDLRFAVPQEVKIRLSKASYNNEPVSVAVYAAEVV